MYIVLFFSTLIMLAYNKTNNVNRYLPGPAGFLTHKKINELLEVVFFPIKMLLSRVSMKCAKSLLPAVKILVNFHFSLKLLLKFPDQANYTFYINLNLGRLSLTRRFFFSLQLIIIIIYTIISLTLYYLDYNWWKV